MIAEPYICIKGPNAGEIEWIGNDGSTLWEEAVQKLGSSSRQRYADFEREKLKELRGTFIGVNPQGEYTLQLDRRGSTMHWSDQINRYKGYFKDTESSRLLKRAEFLKAVCEREGVEWLPKDSREREPKITVCHLYASSGKVPCEPRCDICKKYPNLPERDTYTKAELNMLIHQLIIELESALPHWSADTLRRIVNKFK